MTTIRFLQLQTSRRRPGRLQVTLRLSLLLSGLLTGLLPAAAQSPDLPPDTTFVIVRHAEKAGDDPRDPSLSAAGHARARQLAESLAGSDLVAAYATGYRRTHDTAAPAARTQALAVTSYAASQPPDVFAGMLRATHRRGTVLVVGHGNTVPDIVAALCHCPVAPMPEAEYDRLSLVRIDAEGRARLDIHRYGAPSPATP